MRVVQITYEPKCLVEFTKNDVELLERVSARHYDRVCVAASEQGGIIRGLVNRVECIEEKDEPSAVQELRSVDLDLLMKVIESCGWEHADKLRESLRAAFNQLQSEYTRLNERQA